MEQVIRRTMSDTGVAWRQVRHPLALQLQLRKIRYSAVSTRDILQRCGGAQLYPPVPSCSERRGGVRALAKIENCLDSRGITVNATEWALFPVPERYLCTRRNIPGDLTTECLHTHAGYISE